MGNTGMGLKGGFTVFPKTVLGLAVAGVLLALVGCDALKTRSMHASGILALDSVPGEGESSSACLETVRDPTSLSFEKDGTTVRVFDPTRSDFYVPPVFWGLPAMLHRSDLWVKIEITNRGATDLWIDPQEIRLTPTAVCRRFTPRQERKALIEAAKAEPPSSVELLVVAPSSSEGLPRQTCLPSGITTSARCIPPGQTEVLEAHYHSAQAAVKKGYIKLLLIRPDAGTQSAYRVNFKG